MIDRIRQRFHKYFMAFCEHTIKMTSEKTCELLNNDIQVYQRMLHFEDSALNSKMRGVNDSDLFDGKRVIVSLTTYGKRFYDVYLTIESIMQQTVKPNRIVLWLQEDWRHKEIPILLQKQVERGLEIDFNKDIKSYKKLIPALKKYPDDIIITIDDDTIFASDMLENLLLSYKKFPQYIHTNRAHLIKLLDNGMPDKYTKWEWETNRVGASPLVFPTGGGGTLYPPHSLRDAVFHEDAFMLLCPNADDIWFKAMSLIQGTLCYKVMTHDPYIFFSLKNQDIALKNYNVHKGGNDVQLNNVLSTYHLFELLSK